MIMTVNAEMHRFILSFGFWLCGMTFVQAELQWEKRELEFKPQLGETNVIAHFKFVNSGTQKVTIVNVETSCDCTKAELAKKTYEPGEKGEILIKFDTTHRFGVQQKQIVVRSDSQKESVSILSLKVFIPELLSITPQILLWKKGEATDPKTVKINVAHPQLVKITAITSTIPEFSYHLKVVKAGSEYELMITPATTEKILTGRIQLETDFKSSTPLNLGVHVLVR
jgi:hypothetical protein